MYKYTILLITVILLLSETTLSATIFDESEIGKKNDKIVVSAYKLYDNKKLALYLNRVANRVLKSVDDPQFDYNFKILDSPVVNAFALPGGYVYVTRGLLATLNNEAELANIIGHEISHIVYHHAVKNVKKSVASLLLTIGGLAASPEIRDEAGGWIIANSSIASQIQSGHGQEYESDSDQNGMLFAFEAGYNPIGMSDFLSTLKTIEQVKITGFHGFLATHPETVKRIIDAEQTAIILNGRKKTELFQANFFKNIDGIPYGEAAVRNGIAPYKIRIITIEDENLTYKSVTKRMLGDEQLSIEIAAINGDSVTEKLSKGRMIKLLVPNDELPNVLQSDKQQSDSKSKRLKIK